MTDEQITADLEKIKELEMDNIRIIEEISQNNNSEDIETIRQNSLEIILGVENLLKND